MLGMFKDNWGSALRSAFLSLCYSASILKLNDMWTPVEGITSRRKLSGMYAYDFSGDHSPRACMKLVPRRPSIQPDMT